MQVIILGLNNKTASIETREKLFFEKDRIEDAYNLLLESPDIYGSVIVSTCNRVEIYCAIDNYDNSVSAIINFLCEFHNIKKSDFINSLYIKKSDYAIEHLFKVVSSIDSMVIGEDQIQGQIRDAYIFSFEHSYTNSLLNKLFQSSIQLGKRIRSETQINHGSVSIGSIATDLIVEKFDGDIKVLVIGAGDIADLTLTNLKAKTNSEIHITNRSIQRAIDIANKYDAQICDFETKGEYYRNYDVIVASTSSKDYIINYHEIEDINKRQLYIDLSVPRNISPKVTNNKNISLYSIEDFDSQLTSNKLIREEAISEVKRIIREEANNFYEWYATQTIIPVMKGIKSELNEIAQRTVSEYNSFMNSLDEQQRSKIKNMLLASNDKLIRVIMKNLKNISQESDLRKTTKTLKETICTEPSRLEKNIRIQS